MSDVDCIIFGDRYVFVLTISRRRRCESPNFVEGFAESPWTHLSTGVYMRRVHMDCVESTDDSLDCRLESRKSKCLDATC